MPRPKVAPRLESLRDLNSGGGIESSLGQAHRDAVAVDVSRRLISYLLSAEVSPGDRLPGERRLAELAGVGRSAVREALKSLSLLGLLEIRPGDGTYVRRPDAELLPKVIEWGLLLGEKSIEDLVEARRHTEEIVAGLAAERGSDQDRRRIADAMAALWAARNDRDKFREADVAFHTAIVEAAGNTIYEDILRSVRSLLRMWVQKTTVQTKDFKPFVLEHQRICDAILERDPDAARAAMREHMALAAQRLNAVLPIVRRGESPT